MFPSISPKQSFPALESEILAYWKANNTFKKSIESRPADNPYRFYDGPPFITGTPHYGSLLSSIVKDVVGRYWTMRGKRVDRIWGWDCHGLPIEEKVQKKLGLKSNREIEEHGVKSFIDGCYEYTQSTSAEWDWYIDKIGRWVDMDRAYRTMDQDYMESVMWVFKQLWDKGLIYEGKRVSLYSWKLSTPISNFEVAMDDTYQDVNDPAITVKFRLEQDDNLINEKEGGKFEYTEDGYLRYVLAVVKNEKGEYLMLKNKKHGGKWQCPGGKIDAGETVEEALKREVLEELGISCKVGNKITEKKILASGTLWQGEYYEVVLEGTPTIQEPHKHEKLEWVSLTQGEDGYILKSETESSDDQDFIKKNFDICNLEGNRQNISQVSILAWTTTPWTIPANMALGIGEKIDYALVENNGEGFVVAKNRIESVFKGKGEYTIIYTFSGAELVGLSYFPSFPEYYHGKTGDKSHKVYSADFATDTDGTGIVHIAPEFGDVDFGLAKKYGIPVTEAMDEAGKYTAEIFDMEGTHYLDLENPELGANKINIERMKTNNTLFKLEGITHRVPFCPRSGTPLMQRAQSSWFIDIQSQKEKLLEANKQINWFPEYLKEGRFAKGVESAPDWCISRTRFWGAPMPVWIGEDGEQLVVGSREEIFELNQPFGQLEKRAVDGKEKLFFKGGEFDGTEFNLHKPYIDAIKLQSPKTGNTLTRIPEVLDVWMDSGSMPYAQVHFPFAGFEDPSIRKAETNEEKEACFQFFRTIWKNEFAIDIEEKKKKFFESPIFYISEDPTVVSSIQLSKEEKADSLVPQDSVIIQRLGTTESMRGKGYGTKLIKKVLSDLSKKGEKEAYLNSEITNIDFYKSFGFVQIQDKPTPHGNTKSIYMKKALSKVDELQSLVFPADFIAEYVGQVRAWFYVMHVLGVLLNPNNKPTPTPSFTNVITTGVINGNDGRKMSKSFGNYPDPRVTIEKYGADPIRFYMLNSPLLSGGDMDFKEEGIIETIKSVMLPIWNTYSFFTTYANIDGWEKDQTEVWFARHAESTSNASSTMSDGTDNPELTENGREQAENAGKTLREQGKEFDIIIHTDLIRTQSTARIIAEEIGFSGEYIIDDRFIEQAAGEYTGKTLQEIADMHDADVADHPTLRSHYKNNSTENIEKFENRILSVYEEILTKYKGKRILIIGHAGTSRPVLANYMGMDKETAHYNTRILNADPFRLPTTKITNPLDRWILSKLQVLIGQVHDAMETYDVSRATRSIVEYMDEMTNWYVRLSRRRFWGSEMTADKASGYETLYMVLSEVSKLLAPYMPFLAESIYKGLTDNNASVIARNEAIQVSETTGSPRSDRDDGADENSVHLEYITLPNRHLVDTDLNRDMEIAEHIVSLGLALRSRKNIRVRQPLQSITITRELDEYYQSIIRDELNVKEVRFENPEKLAKKICKPDARKIGPKYGKDVQYIIQQAKAGNFTEGDDGKITVQRNTNTHTNTKENSNVSETRKESNVSSVCVSVSSDFVLEIGEYTMEYIPLEGIGDVEGGHGMVIALDTNITGELELEGYARDIIRAIQDMRKEADYQVTDRISLHIYGNTHAEILAQFGEMIMHETLSTLAPLMVNPDVQKDVELDNGGTLTVQIEK